MNKLSVVVLAGGISSRFFPLREKNLFPFLGQTALEIHLSQINKLQPEKIVLIVNKDSELLFKSLIKKLGTKNIDCIPQEGTGMAGAVISASKLLNGNTELLIVGANDYYENSLYKDFAKKRKILFDKNTIAVAAYKTLSYFPGGYLIFKGNQITGIVEKPGEGNEPSEYVNMVFHYYPSSETLINTVKRTTSKNDDVYEVALDSLIKSGSDVTALKYSGGWKSIKYPWHVLDVMEFFLTKITGQKISGSAAISKSAHIKGSVIIEPGVKIFEGAVISGPCYIGKNVIVGNNALIRESIIGEGSVVGFASEVARSYLKSNVWLHKNYVGDSIFDDNISMGSNAVTANLRLDENNIKIDVKGSLMDTGRNKIGAIIGPNVRIGVSTSIMPGVKIGAGSFVGPGVVLGHDIGENSFVTQKKALEITKNKVKISIKSRENIVKRLNKN